ncbi:MAG: acyl-CoA dehydrogenase family protein [Candidatus Krumholzibacteria bacterium]|jgi:glutaryl-CoA dehydrogenase|nr:acyl-CoA dehydrogenase family protein [Candidatus Krumholzibacteria bacterium]MDP6798033.1 acyl-CoA dehydrogenase family protein [Candidatus Krumholzibacteria bacterium]MDP7021946.1 acyl-CoA dehydrogenase family protein [Candidatus Krumholzibacteria bacterium]
MSHWLDLYRMDDLLSEEERIIQRTVRDFVEKEALPHLPELWEKGEFPRELASRMGEIGLFGPTLSGYGLPGLGSRAYGLMMLELERGDSGLRSFASVQGSLCMYPIHRFGSEEQKTRWLPELASGKKIACFGLTEPDSGSDPGGMKTRATKDGDDWLLQGSKMWITNGTLADLALVWAMTEDGIRGFLVEKGTPGFTADSIKGKMSLRASDTASLAFDEVRLGPEALLPETRNLGSALSCLNQARYSIAWGTLGAAMACLEEAADFSRDRVSFGKSLDENQLIQKELADMLASLIQGRLLVERLAELKDAGEVTAVQISLAKRENSARALEIARRCRQVLGANGISLEYQAGRHACNLESIITYEGTHEIHTLILGKEITGKAAF